jgi:hypothetical protein
MLGTGWIVARRGARAWLGAGVLLLAFVLLVSRLAFGDRASAAVPGTPAYVGLNQPYTYHTGCGGGPVDPLNVVWFGSYATSAHVAAALSLYGGWTHDDYNSPYGVDVQAVQASAGCTRDRVQRADGCAICVRDHIRLFATANNGVTYVTGDAHHDSLASFLSGCNAGVIAGHYSSDFNGPRERITSFWPGGLAHYDYWGNTRQIKQCNGSMPHSDGFVAAFRALPT